MSVNYTSGKLNRVCEERQPPSLHPGGFVSRIEIACPSWFIHWIDSFIKCASRVLDGLLSLGGTVGNKAVRTSALMQLAFRGGGHRRTPKQAAADSAINVWETKFLSSFWSMVLDVLAQAPSPPVCTSSIGVSNSASIYSRLDKIFKLMQANVS